MDPLCPLVGGNRRLPAPHILAWLTHQSALPPTYLLSVLNIETNIANNLTKTAGNESGAFLWPATVNFIVIINLVLIKIKNIIQDFKTKIIQMSIVFLDDLLVTQKLLRKTGSCSD